jgi:hypothetical protein
VVEDLRDGFRLVEREELEAEGKDLVEHGVVADDQRSSSDHGLDDRVAESLDGRREHHDVRGRVRVVRARAEPDGDRDRAAGEQPVELAS